MDIAVSVTLSSFPSALSSAHVAIRLDPPPHEPVSLDSLLGWTYTIAWSLSFYPQFILNYRRKSSTGLSSDFVAINPTGHFSLLIVNLALYLSSTVRRQYQSRHEGHLPQVRLNDVYFSAHATLLASLTLLQSFYYKRDPSQRISTFNRFFLAFVLVSTILLFFVAASSTFSRFEYFDVITYLSYIKLYISFAKYVPQVRLNHSRKSTVGWSIENILLDLTGGTLSLAQLVLDSWSAHDWRGITGNPAKLGLSVLTLGFDFIFIVQHYILYRDSTTTLLHPAPSPRSMSSSSFDEEQGRGSGREQVDETVDVPPDSTTRVDENFDERNGLVEETRFKKTRTKSQLQKMRRKDGERQPLLD
ncbi:hypothetical protein JCM5350_001387 [Sporobolomyces pararoseus]